MSALTSRPAGAAALRTELEVALHLQRGATIAPSPELLAEVHHHGDHVLTFWRHQAHDPGAALEPSAAARALEAVHRALDTSGGPLPSFLSRQVRRAGRLFEDPQALRALPAPERPRGAEHARLTAALADRAMDCRALHGDPHRGNFLAGREAA